MVDVTGSASRVQARRTARRGSLLGALALVLYIGAAASAQDRLPPAPGPVGAIRRDASGQIVPVEPLAAPGRRPTRGSDPAARQSAPSTIVREPADDGRSGRSDPPARTQPSPGSPTIHCVAPALACVLTRVSGGNTNGYATILVSAVPGMLPDGTGTEPEQPAPGDVPIQLDVLARHDDGTVSLALVTIVLNAQLQSRGSTLVLRLRATGAGHPLRAQVT